MTTLRTAPEPSERLRLRVAAEVRAWRGRLGYTQTQLAQALQVSQGSVSAKLKGQTPFSLDEIDQLAALFGITPAMLLGGTQPMAPPPPTPIDGGTTHGRARSGSTSGYGADETTPGDLCLVKLDQAA